MADETQILKNRFKELSARSQNRGIYTYSDFLNIYEQSLLQSEIKYGYTFYGGYDDAERKIACFGDENTFGYAPTPPLVLIAITPLSAKFSDDLSHRDFLGSLIGLGIKRETLGDIVVTDNKGYVFCLETVVPFITQNLTKVRHTSVCCTVCDELPSDILPTPTEKIFTVSSLRLDVLISAVYCLSRSKSCALTQSEKVFVDGKLTTSPSFNIDTGSTVSVRGYGRFRCVELCGNTKKNKIRIKCEVN